MSAWDDAVKAELPCGEDNWRYVDHDPAQPLWQAPEVRRYAWWSVLEGAMGHTYGHNAIIQFYEKGQGRRRVLRKERLAGGPPS